MVVDPKITYFEMIMSDDQEFSFETDTAGYWQHMKIKGSDENQKFYEYLSFISTKNKEADPLRKKLEGLEEGSDDETKLKDELKNIDEAVKAHQNKFIETNPKNFFTKVLKAQRDPEIPDAPLLENGQKDSTFAFKYYKKHYFDNIDFSEEGMLRTPFFHKKLDYYLEKLTLQIPDSLIKSVEYLVKMSEANEEIFKYVIITATNKYAKSKIMGFDAVYVHMVDQYYATGKAHWTEADQLKKIIEQADKIKPTLLGKKVPNLVLPKLNIGNPYEPTVDLHKLDANFILLYFWDPSCGHCKKFTPKLHDFYVEKKDSIGLKVYSIMINKKVEEYQEFLDDKELPEGATSPFTWIDVWDPFNKSKMRDHYDLRATPVLIVLDKNKKIIAKRPELDDVLMIMERHSKNEAQEYKEMHEEE
jgi:thiol-disulfide isomerase/thioredoxin